MKEDDGNLGNEMLMTMRDSQNLLEVGFRKAYAEGQLHPSPQTIKKIQTEFAEKVKEAIAIQQLENETVWGEDARLTYQQVVNIIDNTLKKEKEGEED